MQVKNNLDNNSLMVNESLLSTSNGYFGVRGNFEEGYRNDYDTIRGTYINGFYETTDITYGEGAFGYPNTSQKIVNVIDGQTIKIYIDGELFNLFDGKVIDFKRKLDIEKGYSLRYIEWISKKGHHLKITIKRLASFTTLELFIIDYEVESVNYSGEIQIESTLNADVKNYSNKSDQRVASGHTKLLHVDKIDKNHGIATISSKTKISNLTIASSMNHNLNMEYTVKENSIIGMVKKNIKASEKISLIKYISFTDSIRHDDCFKESKNVVNVAMKNGEKYYFKDQEEYLNEFWKYSKINIDGEIEEEKAINYNIYQLLSSIGKVKNTNISAKGLSGEGYEGHYFWDTEIYMVPFFTLTNPQLAKRLLKFRYETLESAKIEAEKLGHKKGVKIPWRTISGSECSAYFLSGSAQYHINADVAYSYIQYYLATNDTEFLKEFGLEVLYKTALLWLDVGYFNNEGKFSIDAVTGPDEYTVMVNNNYYTNSLAKYHLKWVCKLSSILEKENISDWNRLKSKIAINENELTNMKNASEKMILLYSDELKINLQDDAFLKRKEWDLENTSEENYPLLLHYHPLYIYRYKVSKQADTILAHFLLDNETDIIMKNSYSYYEKITTHDSSLSPCIFSIMASRIKKIDKAYHYYKMTSKLDIENIKGNTKDGLHIANAGGVYMTIVYGFSGLRIKENGIHLSPIKPKEWTSYTFRINYKNSLVKVTISDKINIETEKEISLIIDKTKYLISGKRSLNYNNF
ncbi:glycoside hydrolase family 65 protein [Helicovermis profundi]|uniref:Glycosyl hydrolase family 65 protein n=1 Tax=Helicovermis profundi TaxID=3065157 RepID=A0AAU9E241_9FIRM|nr:glycosyl hydrolase family 65 protein [Clostridia bacterium S502]